MSDFQPTRAIITGSESGIGRATAVALASAGMDIGITYLSEPERAEATAAEVRELGRQAYVEQIDVSDLATAGAVIDRLVEQLGGVDVIVADAGTGDNAPFLEMTLDQWRHTVSTDLDGAFVTIQAAAKHMVAAGNGGRIIGITSVHEHQPRYGSSAYDAAKHGLGGLLKTVAIELAQYGITANAVAPGEIATRMTGAEDEDPQTIDRPGVPLGRPGNAWEIAAAVAFLASRASSYITGVSLPVDGGMLQMGPHGGSHITSNDWRSA
ncbi:SDR family oxidoreductase [Curtobacterium pusillum]|uniref:SDR family oxidoreductase n=1 Tax=Curtobacterium pusillum TaxID=69373 RepID=A0ABX2M5A0_9MICO|nr:SDR family oxidoreductase [Curtobacterium pusillum]NUU12493.1 SDR family oxidoreductase [Curtobacterium pusillum]GLK33004.1 oxidoreductase [Curtobacterium pusillum]